MTPRSKRPTPSDMNIDRHARTTVEEAEEMLDLWNHYRQRTAAQPSAQPRASPAK